MNKRTKNKTIQVITIDNIVRNYYLEIPYSSGRGRVLVMEYEVAAFAVHAQDEGQGPQSLGNYSSSKNAESYAKWMALGL